MTLPTMVNAAALLASGLTVLTDIAVAPPASLFLRRLDAMHRTSQVPRPTRRMRAVLHDSVRVLDRFLGGARSIETLQAQAGYPRDHTALRVEQAVWGWAAAMGASVLVGARATTSAMTPFAGILLVLSCVATGILLPDQLLRRTARHRTRRMVGEFPVVADLMALAVTAGQGPVEALDHVAGRTRGPLGAELRRSLVEVRSGTPVVVAMEALADRVHQPVVTRFVETFAVALERGTPLAEVLRSQAADVRQSAKEQLIEEAGRRDVLMLVPVVFLILPLTVVFAVYPQLSALSLQ